MEGEKNSTKERNGRRRRRNTKERKGRRTPMRKERKGKEDLSVVRAQHCLLPQIQEGPPMQQGQEQE